MANFIKLLVSFLVSFLGGPAAAQTFEITTPQYGVGVPMVDAIAEARATCAAYARCVGDSGSCEIMILGSSSDDEHFDLSRWPEYTAEANLAGARASNFSRQINDQCRRMDVALSWDHVHMVPPNPHAAAQDRYAVSGVRPTVDGGTAAARQVKTTAYSVEDLLHVGAALSRPIRDASNRKCAWEITAQWHSPMGNHPGYVTTSGVKKLDPNCGCDGEGPAVSEAAFGRTLEMEVGNRPLAYPDDPAEAANQYDATRSVVTDDLGATWDEELFFSHGKITIRKERDLCAEEAEAGRQKALQTAETNRLNGYRFDLYGRGNFMAGAVNVPSGSPFEVAEGPMLSGLLEGGIHVGSSYVNWTLGGLLGPEHNPNCSDPATLAYGGVTGVTALRPYPVGVEAHLGWTHSVGTFADGDGNYLDAERDSTFLRVGPRFHTGETVTLGFDGWMTTYWLNAKAGSQFSDTNAQGGGIAGFVEARF